MLFLTNFSSFKYQNPQNTPQKWHYVVRIYLIFTINFEFHDLIFERDNFLDPISETLIEIIATYIDTTNNPFIPLRSSSTSFKPVRVPYLIVEA